MLPNFSCALDGSPFVTAGGRYRAIFEASEDAIFIAEPMIPADVQQLGADESLDQAEEVGVGAGPVPG